MSFFLFFATVPYHCQYASQGGAAHLDRGTISVGGCCEFASNSVVQGGAVFVGYASSAIFSASDCAFSGNEATSGDDIYNHGGTSNCNANAELICADGSGSCSEASVYSGTCYSCTNCVLSPEPTQEPTATSVPTTSPAPSPAPSTSPQPTPGPTPWGLDTTSPGEGASWLHCETHVIVWGAPSSDSVDLYL